MDNWSKRPSCVSSFFLSDTHGQNWLNSRGHWLVASVRPYPASCRQAPPSCLWIFFQPKAFWAVSASSSGPGGILSMADWAITGGEILTNEAVSSRFRIHSWHNDRTCFACCFRFSVLQLRDYELSPDLPILFETDKSSGRLSCHKNKIISYRFDAAFTVAYLGNLVPVIFLQSRIPDNSTTYPQVFPQFLWKSSLDGIAKATDNMAIMQLN
jgi:hypothetical protein